MRIAVLGAGLLGVATAYYLMLDGHEVSVIERQAEAGQETSFANGGQISADSAGPWMTPGMPLRAVKWALSRDAPLVARPRLDPALFAWLARATPNCTPRRYAHNYESSLRMARYGRECLADLAARADLAYDAHRNGILHVFRSRKELDGFARELPALRRLGARADVLDHAGCLDREPALGEAQAPLAGGVFFPDDGGGDCHMLTQGLAALGREQGVAFRFNEEVTGLATRGGRIDAVLTGRGRHAADAVVVALGSYSARLLRPLDVKLPIYPVKGYTVTMPITGRNTPGVSLTDESNKVVITKLGNRIRAAGTADLAGYDRRIDPARCDLILRDVEAWYPGCGDSARVERWACLRPMTPDCLPVLGPTAYSNLYLNTGHGSLGWTMGCGSARMVADMIAGRRPEIEASDFSATRFA